ncbi:MAG: spermine synthase [Chloroflexota bacterium]|nr:spermine synthase [Chloroflexota bacterium]
MATDSFSKIDIQSKDNMIFSHYQTRALTTQGVPSIMPLSTDLGRSTVQVEKTNSGWRLPNGEILSFAQIQIINEDQNSCFLFIDGQIRKAEAFSETTYRYYTLMPTKKAPTMLISGIPMHRIKNTNPVEDTARKLKALGKPYGCILDTSTGLGYTAIEAAKSADKVITIEFDPTVIDICKINPWSRALFSNPKIHKIIGDSISLAEAFNDASFNAIIHDPPTFQIAGDLYAKSLYQTFYRILKNKGRMFHYIGNPNSRSGATVGRGVVERLEAVGFSVKPKGSAFGVLAQK